MKQLNLKNRIVSIFLAIAIFNFNLVLLPAQAAEGCKCGHSHEDGEFACYCGVSQKPSCNSKGPTLSKRHCGLEKRSNDFCIPAHDHPTVLLVEYTDLDLFVSILKEAGSIAISGIDLPPTERPPSIL
jgi:hypothetical protein